MSQWSQVGLELNFLNGYFYTNKSKIVDNYKKKNQYFAIIFKAKNKHLEIYVRMEERPDQAQISYTVCSYV